MQSTKLKKNNVFSHCYKCPNYKYIGVSPFEPGKSKLWAHCDIHFFVNFSQSGATRRKANTWTKWVYFGYWRSFYSNRPPSRPQTPLTPSRHPPDTPQTPPRHPSGTPRHPYWFGCFNYFYWSITCAGVRKTKFLTRHLRWGTWKKPLNMDDFEVFSHLFPFCISSYKP